MSQLRGSPTLPEPVHFDDIPTMFRWKVACYGRFYTRTSHDKILMELERQIEQFPDVKKFYQRDRQANAYPMVRALGNIYTTSGYWIKENRELTDKTRPRYPAIAGIQRCAARILRKIFGINDVDQTSTVGQKLRSYLLTPLSNHGKMVDSTERGPLDPQLLYLNEAQAASKRVYWRGGLAYHMRGQGGMAEMVPLDTTSWTIDTTNQAHMGVEHNDPNSPPNPLDPNMVESNVGVGGFAITYSKIVYCDKHNVESGNLFYHSSYLGGESVVCAGAMTFVRGQLTYINNASGHYQPPPKQLYMALEVLRMFDVRLDDVVVDIMNTGKGGGVFIKYSFRDFMNRYRGF